MSAVRVTRAERFAAHARLRQLDLGAEPLHRWEPSLLRLATFAESFPESYPATVVQASRLVLASIGEVEPLYGTALNILEAVR